MQNIAFGYIPNIKHLYTYLEHGIGICSAHIIVACLKNSDACSKKLSQLGLSTRFSPQNPVGKHSEHLRAILLVVYPRSSKNTSILLSLIIGLFFLGWLNPPKPNSYHQPDKLLIGTIGTIGPIGVRRHVWLGGQRIRAGLPDGFGPASFGLWTRLSCTAGETKPSQVVV
jgi:hypothetical protein